MIINLTELFIDSDADGGEKLLFIIDVCIDIPPDGGASGHQGRLTLLENRRRVI